MIPVIISTLSSNGEFEGYGGLWWRCNCAISCEVTEKRNGEYELNLVVPVISDDGVKVLDWVAKYNAISVKPNLYDEELMFIIDTIESDGITITAHANQEWFMFKNRFCTSIRTAQSTVDSAMSTLNGAVNKKGLFNKEFTFGGMKSGTTTDAPFSNRDVASVFDNVMDIAENFHGELYVRNVNGKKYVSVYAPTRGVDTNYRIGYGMNITSIEYEDNSEDAYNGVCPYYCDNDTTVVAGDIELDPNVISWRNYKLFDVTGEYSEGTKPTASQLSERSYAMRTTVSAKGNTNIVVRIAVDKDNDLNRLKLCDTVLLDYSPLNIKNKRIQFTGYTFDVLAEVYTEMVFGEDEKLTKTLLAQERRSKTYERERKSTANRFAFKFTRNGKWVTISQSGSVKPSSSTQTLTAYIPRGFRPMYTQSIKASDPEKSNTTITYKFYKNGNIVITPSYTTAVVQGSRNFTIGYETGDSYPRK